jgi:hypothetical protein
MLTTAEHWRLNVIAEADRMAATAMDTLGDLNEARFAVHEIMLSAMTDMLGPVSPGQLDRALAAALHARTQAAAND